MPTKTMNPTLGDVLKYELNPAVQREMVTLLSGSVYLLGSVLGRVTVGNVGGAAAAGNTGTGTIGTLSAGTGARPGVYRAVCIEPATNAGKFAVFAPDGRQIGVATVAVEFSGEVVFTIADGGTDFASGDAFNITVAAGTNKAKLAPHTAADGSDQVYGMLLFDVDASDGDVESVAIVRGPAEVNKDQLVYASSVDDADKKAIKLAELAALGIVPRDAA